MRNFIVFTESEKDIVVQQSVTELHKLAPRLVDNPDHTLFGKYVLLEQVTTGEYEFTWDYALSELPRIEAAPEALFLPVEG